MARDSSSSRLYCLRSQHGSALCRRRAHIGYAGSHGTGYGQLKTPTDVAIDACNRLYVTSYASAKVVVWGIDDYCDPATAVPALSWLRPAQLHLHTPRSWVTVFVEIDGVDPALIDPSSLAIDDRPVVVRHPVIDDHDQNLTLDLAFKLPVSELVLPMAVAGSHTLHISGRLATGETFASEASLELRP